MIDSVPSDSYGKQINDQIEKLQLVGEAFIEHYFLLNAITDPQNLNLTFNDLENLKIQTLKFNNLNELAKVFDLPKKMLSNVVVPGGQPREPFKIIHAMIGALALFAGVEPAFHLLEILQIIKKPKPTV